MVFPGDWCCSFHLWHTGFGWEVLHRGENEIKNIGEKSKKRETFQKERMGEDEAATWQREKKGFAFVLESVV